MDADRAASCRRAGSGTREARLRCRRAGPRARSFLARRRPAVWLHAWDQPMSRGRPSASSARTKPLREALPPAGRPCSRSAVDSREGKPPARQPRAEQRRGRIGKHASRPRQLNVVAAGLPPEALQGVAQAIPVSNVATANRSVVECSVKGLSRPGEARASSAQSLPWPLRELIPVNDFLPQCRADARTFRYGTRTNLRLRSEYDAPLRAL